MAFPDSSSVLDKFQSAIKVFDSLTKANQVSLARIHFSHPESDGILSSDVGVRGRIGILTLGSKPPNTQRGVV